MKLFVLLCFFSGTIWAQDSIVDSYFISLKPKAGYLAAHRGTMGHLPKERIFGAELSFSKRLGGANNWAANYKNPMVGVSLYASTVGNKEILGNTFGWYSFIQFPMSRNPKHFLAAKISAGLGYVTKVFDQQTNPKNVAMSSHVNALLCLGIEGRWQFSPKHALIYSFDMTHLSNGSSKVPNLGLNMPNIGLGYSYTVKEKTRLKVAPLVIQHTPFLRSWNYTTLGILSFKETFPTGGKKYPVYAISNFVWKQFRPKVGMEIALDVFSKQAIFDYRWYIPKTQLSVLQIGGYVGYLLPLNRLKFVLGMGAYIKDRYNMDDRFYHRVGMRYQFDNGLLVNLVLKSHWAKADYVEYGIGYTFKSKRK